MSEKYKIWIFSGEASGDMFGARLAKELKNIAGEKIDIAGMGGPCMQEVGIDIMIDSTELGVVGLFEIIKHIFTFINIFLGLERRAKKERPDAVVLIDYPGFNIRFAKRMYKAGIPVIWYITPQVWAWGKKRIPLLAKICRKMMVIFPFEEEVFAGTGLDVEFVGHPLVEIIHEKLDESIKRDKERVVLLPGSRFNEINRLLEPMLETATKLHENHPTLKFAVSAPREKVLGRIKEIHEEFKSRYKGENIPEFDITCGETTRWLQEAGTGLAASGTVTVECAISGLPIVACYKLNTFTFILARMFIKLFRGFFAMPNIIANKEIYKELLQRDVTPENLSEAVEKILPGGERRDQVIKDLKGVVETISAGKKVSPSRRAAEVCLKFMEENSKSSTAKI